MNSWITNLDELKKLTKFADDKEFQKQWQEAKIECKEGVCGKDQKMGRIAIESGYVL